MSALEPTAVAVFWWTCQASLAASLLFLAVRLVQRAFGRVLGVSGCYALSLLVLARLFMPTLLPSHFSFMNVLPLRREEVRSSKPEIRFKSEVRTPKSESVPSTATLGESPAPLWMSTGGMDEELSPKVLTTPNSERGLPAARLTRTVAVASWIWLLGAVGFMSAVGARQRRFRRWVARQEPSRDARVEQLLWCARSAMAMRQSFRVIVTNNVATPALIGWYQPTLLLPDSVMGSLDDRQLMMVLMHELAHVKRRDVLLNWVMIGAQSLHWFNPVIWAAFRRLRADRELVCDAMVLQRLEKEDHRIYGGTLLKVAELFKDAIPCPALLSVLNNRSEIKRRINMIARFTMPKRTAWMLTAALLVVLCALTFTRAADQKKPPVAVPETAVTTSSNASSRENTLDQLRHRLDELDGRILSQQASVDQLRIELAIPSDVADRPGTSSLEPETVRLIERERITSEAMAARYETLYKELKSKSRSELAQALPTAVPDSELTALLRDLNQAEMQFEKISGEYGPDHPLVKTTAKMLETLKKQIDARVQGILAGLAAQTAAQKASAETLARQVENTVRRDAELARRYRPYFQAQRELSLLEQTRDSLKLQYLQKQFGGTE